MTKKITAGVLPTLLALLFMLSELHGQSRFFIPVDDGSLPKAVDVVVKNIEKMSVLYLNKTDFCQYPLDASVEFQNTKITLPLEIKLPGITTETSSLVQSYFLASDIAALDPKIKSYIGNRLKYPSATIRVTLTFSGFHALILDLDGQEVYFEHYSEQNKIFTSIISRMIPSSLLTFGVEDAKSVKNT